MKVLVADDNAISRRMLESLLTEWGYEVTIAGDGEEAWRILQTGSAPRLAIIDWIMPGLDGLEICQQVRLQAQVPYIYILMVTVRDQIEDLIAGMDAGADDYIAKPFDVHELKARLRAGRRILDLQEELLSAQEHLWVRATHDCVTGLWNRAKIIDFLQQELNRADREVRPVGVLIADVDHFKLVNDTYGHTAGDAVLREVGRRMRVAVRSYDQIGRYGGDEFLLVLPGCDSWRAFKLAERIRARIAEKVMEMPEVLLQVTVSLGVTAVEEKDGKVTDAGRLIQLADKALYRAKAGGRDRVELVKGRVTT